MIRKQTQTVQGERWGKDASVNYTAYSYKGKHPTEIVGGKKLQSMQRAYAKKKTAENKAKATAEMKRRVNAINNSVFGK